MHPAIYFLFRYSFSSGEVTVTHGAVKGTITICPRISGTITIQPRILGTVDVCGC